MKKKIQKGKIDISKVIKKESRKTKIPPEKVIPDRKKDYNRKKEKAKWKKDMKDI